MPAIQPAETLYVEKDSDLAAIDDDIPVYKYPPLSGPDRIRTLELHATDSDTIECVLREVGVLENGYQALSYVWGTDEKPARALVRDGPDGNTLGYIPLTANVHRTLQDLRDAPGIPKKTFWIDQICIDQVGEKNGQVAMMGSIYKNADRVIFYGGAARDDEFETQGIELVRRLDAHFSPNYQAMYEIKNLFVAYQKRHTLPVQHMPDDIAQDMNKHATAFQWLAEVGYGEWRQRLWMVQEQLLARELGFLRGPRLLSWTSVAAATFCFYLRFLPPSYVFDFWERPTNDHTLPPAKRWRSPWDIASSVFSVWQPQYGAMRGLGSSTLLENIYVYQHLECRDLRDRVYSVLAISSDTDRLEIVPDYLRSPADFFHELSVKLLRVYDNMYPLYVASCWDNLLDPSYPSWAFQTPHPCLLRPHLVPFRISNAVHPYPAFTPGNEPRFSEDRSVLVVKGRQVDKATLAMPRIYFAKSVHLGIFDDSAVASFSGLLGTWTEILALLGATFENACSLVSTFTPDPTWAPPATGIRSGYEEMATHFWWYFRHIHLGIEANRRPDDQDGELRSRAREEVLSALKNDMVRLGLLEPSSYADDILPDENRWMVTEFPGRMYIHGRSFAATRGGRICNVMNEVREGDVMVALQGWSRGFFALRPVDGADVFRVVGEAWVSGLMGGQVYNESSPAELDVDIQIV
ncbi:ankyrin and het domain protein [Colletotrichum musicola]|uniref:Ankyrin and het domain protein n=1 Tax=Colletotrichum musicola TaxID=2175873 RepID=A0A8H6UAJ7_9PEZI|nr:ankyrin and het domain protein [Colletotrichum musicola]